MDVNKKIFEMESQLRYVQRELDELKSYLSESQNESKIPIPLVPNKASPSVPQITAPIPPLPKIDSQSESIVPKATPKYSVPIPTEEFEAQKNINLENFIGKYIMGIAASVLIFIGLIFFGILIYKNFTDTLKMLSVYATSSVLLGTGLFFLHKKKNIFCLSLAGCGLGAFYTSFILTNAYFHMINDIMLYGLLFLWAIGVLFISKKYEANIISIIGEVGILIASLFGMSKATTDKMFLLLTIFTIISSCLFLLTLSEQYKKVTRYVLALSNAILLCFFSTSSCRNIYNGVGYSISFYAIQMLFILYALFLFVYLAKEMLTTKIEDIIIYGLTVLLLVCSSSVFIVNLGLSRVPWLGKSSGIIPILWFFGWWLFVELKHFDKIVRNMLITIFYAIILLLFCNFTEILMGTISFSIFYLPLLFYGSWKKDDLYKIFAYVTLFIQISAFPTKYLPSVIITGISLIFAGIILWIQKAEYKFKYKLGHYIAFLLYVFVTLYTLSNHGDVYKFNIPLIYMDFALLYSVSIVTLGMILGGWSKNFATNEPEHKFESLLHSVCLFSLGFGISICYNSHLSLGMHFITILWLTVLCCFGAKATIKRHGIEVGAVLLAVKYTVYIQLILHSFKKQSQTLTSILCLLIAITCILIGFKIKAKYLRIYGLILTMLAVAKLLLVDITYHNSVTRMISFLVCGVLCFVINFIYNVVAKKMDTDEENIG